MRIDEARHERAAADLDPVSITHLYRPIGHFADDTAFNQYFHAFAALGIGAVEYARVPEKNS